MFIFRGQQKRFAGSARYQVSTSDILENSIAIDIRIA